ncbi:MAK10-like protein, partial [Tanacetum coccineum]
GVVKLLGDYSKPSHEGYKNTIELPDPNQHLKDFLKLVDSLVLDGENRERTRLCLFQFSLRDQASNWLERLPAGSITTWEDLTTQFLAQFFPPGRTAKLRNDILMFQQHHGESLSEAWTRFKDLLQKVPHHGIDLWLQLRDRNAEESWALLEDLALYDNESWNDPRDFTKPVKAIALPQDVPSTSDRRLIELENQVQRLMEAHLAPTQPTQVNKITTSCEICSGPHDTQYCIEDLEQAFVEYASSRTDEAGGKWYTFKPEQNNLGDTYNPSWRSHPNLRWRQPQNSQNNFSNPPNRFQPNGSIPNRSFNNRPQNFNNKSNVEGLNDLRDFTKPVKAIALPQDVPSTSDRRLIELENQVQRLMEAHLAPTQPTQVNKITTSCEICNGPHDTQYCMEDLEQAFVEYASSRTDEAGGKWYTFKPEQNNLGDTYNPSWRSHPNLRWRQPQNSQNNFSNPPNRFQPNGSIPNRSFNNHPQNFNNQSNLEGLVSDFMASQDARLSKFEADFKQQQREMTNKIDTVLKAITDRISGTLPSDTVKNPKLSTYPVLSARSYPTEDPQCSTQNHEEDNPENIYVDPPTLPDPSVTFITEKVLKFNSFFELLRLVPPSSNTELICTKEDDGDVMFIKIIPMDDNFRKEEPEAEGQEVEYFDIFPTRSELAYHKYLMCGPIPSIFLRNPIIMEGGPSNLKIPCNIRHAHVNKAYIDLNSS